MLRKKVPTTNKCQHPGGVDISLLGHDVDPCRYENKYERHENVNVIVKRCKVCGNVDISWERTENTVDYILED